jgi:hypothetical protein
VLSGAVFNTPGHYFSGFKTASGQWTVLNDSQVTTYTAHSFSSFSEYIGYARPYLLLYKKEGMSVRPSEHSLARSPLMEMHKAGEKQRAEIKQRTKDSAEEEQRAKQRTEKKQIAEEKQNAEEMQKLIEWQKAQDLKNQKLAADMQSAAVNLNHQQLLANMRRAEEQRLATIKEQKLADWQRTKNLNKPFVVEETKSVGRRYAGKSSQEIKTRSTTTFAGSNKSNKSGTKTNDQPTQGRKVVQSPPQGRPTLVKRNPRSKHK